MAFHVPFEHRRNGQPIYIGFTVPPRRRAFNWWAFFGFPFSLLALLTAGLLSPIALIMNLVALRKSPRRLATAGTIISLIGVGIISTIAIAATASGMHHHKQAELAKMSKLIKKQSQETAVVIDEVAKEFDAYTDTHEGKLPAWVDADMIATSYEDSWGMPLRFDAEGDHALLRSAGHDKQFYTPDDIVKRVEGEASRSVLIEL